MLSTQLSIIQGFGVGGRMKRQAFRRSRGVIAVVCASTLLLSSCVTTQSGRIGTNDGSDVCRPYLEAMDATGDYFAEDMLKGAALGALTGALIGGLTTQDAKGAAIGAVAGAAAGGAGGYFIKKRQQDTDKRILYTSIRDDLDRDLAKGNEAVLSIKKLSDCRTDALAAVARDYKAGKIDTAQAKQRWRTLLDQRKRDVDLAEAMSKEMLTRAKEFENAATQLTQMPWDEKAKQEFGKRKADMAGRHAQEAKQFDLDAKVKRKAATTKKEKSALETALKTDRVALLDRQKSEMNELLMQEQGTLPTGTYQMLAQNVMAGVQADRTKLAQQMGTENPDAFESALPTKPSAGKGWVGGRFA